MEASEILVHNGVISTHDGLVVGSLLLFGLKSLGFSVKAFKGCFHGFLSGLLLLRDP